MPPLSGHQLSKPKVNLVSSLSRPLLPIDASLHFSPCLLNLLVKFVSFILQQFEVRLMMAQGIQPIPVESGPNPYRSLEQSQETSIPLGRARVCSPGPGGKRFRRELRLPYPLRKRVQTLGGNDTGWDLGASAAAHSACA